MNFVLTWIKNGSPLQYSCLKHSMDRGAWWATVHGVPNGWTWLKWLSTHTYPQKDCKNFYMNCTKPADKFRDITDIFTTLSKVFLFIFLVLLLFYQHFVLFSYQKTVLSCVWLCDPLDCSPPDFSDYGILQARIQEWVAISSSRDLLDPGIELPSPALAGRSFATAPPGKPCFVAYSLISLFERLVPGVSFFCEII